MANYNSSDANLIGQYPAPAFAGFGLPVQDETSGASGSAPAGGQTEDVGGTLEPGQYPDREDFTGVPLGGSGAPGSEGVGRPQPQRGPDSVTWSLDTTQKSEHDTSGQGLAQGYIQKETAATVAGPGNWTEANADSYAGADGLFLPGLAGNMPLPGSGQYQTDGGTSGAGTQEGGVNSSGRVMYGGFLNGARPGHPR